MTQVTIDGPGDELRQVKACPLEIRMPPELKGDLEAELKPNGFVEWRTPKLPILKYLKMDIVGIPSGYGTSWKLLQFVYCATATVNHLYMGHGFHSWLPRASVSSSLLGCRKSTRRDAPDDGRC